LRYVIHTPLRRTQGGFSTKLHACCDALGYSRFIILSPGQQSSDHREAQVRRAQISQGAGPVRSKKAAVWCRQ
jgi:hypothetical protein